MTLIATLAQQEWHRRRAKAQAAVDAGRYPRAEAESALRPWLALAVRAGADPADYAGTGAAEVIEDYRRVRGLTPGEVRWLAADLICRQADQLAELARARDVAVAKAMAAPLDRALQQRATNLQVLAIHFGAPPRAQVAAGGSASQNATASPSPVTPDPIRGPASLVPA